MKKIIILCIAVFSTVAAKASRFDTVEYITKHVLDVLVNRPPGMSEKTAVELMTHGGIDTIPNGHDMCGGKFSLIPFVEKWEIRRAYDLWSYNGYAWEKEKTLHIISEAKLNEWRVNTMLVLLFILFSFKFFADVFDVSRKVKDQLEKNQKEKARTTIDNYLNSTKKYYLIFRLEIITPVVFCCLCLVVGWDFHDVPIVLSMVSWFLLLSIISFFWRKLIIRLSEEYFAYQYPVAMF